MTTPLVVGRHVLVHNHRVAVRGRAGLESASRRPDQVASASPSRALLVGGALQIPPSRARNACDRRELRVVVIPATRPAVRVQAPIERCLVAELFSLDAITPAQAMGGAVVLLGLALAGCEDREPADVVARASWPDAGPVTVESPRSEEAIGIR